MPPTPGTCCLPPESGSGLHRRRSPGLPLALGLAGVILVGCAQPRGKRWNNGDSGGAGPTVPDRPLLCGDPSRPDVACDPERGSEVLLRGELDSEFYRIVRRDCAVEQMVCVDGPPLADCDSRTPLAEAPIIGCATCLPCAEQCVRNNVARCLPDGSGWHYIHYCDTGRGEVCAEGRCGNGCELAASYASNVGCEYYAVDLDNAVVRSGSAAAQQFAVVVSNPSPLEAIVRVEVCRHQPCQDPDNRDTLFIEGQPELVVNPDDLETLLLDAREVDGSPAGAFNEGSHTALGPVAYRITSTAPIVLYQFNPYDNRVQVFSNDASLLIPVTAWGQRYTVLSWPQTIAYTPGTGGTDMDIDLRAFLTIVAVSPGRRCSSERRRYPGCTAGRPAEVRGAALWL